MTRIAQVYGCVNFILRRELQDRSLVYWSRLRFVWSSPHWRRPVHGYPLGVYCFTSVRV